MTQTAYNIRMDKALKALAERFKSTDLNITNPVNGQPPKYTNEYIEKVAASMNLARNVGPDAIIDVQFDYRNIILYIISHITKDYPDLVVRDHPCLTPMSFIGYCLALTYGLALLNDDENVRSVRSFHAQQFANDRNLGPVLNDIRNLAVPPFMNQILKSTTVSTDDRKPNLRFVYSLACFDFTHDFPRTIPINLFFAAHHVIATNQANTPVATLMNTWLNSEVMSQPAPTSVAQYIGMDPNYHTNLNWLSGPLLQMFNPTTGRSHTQRPTLNTINLKSQIHANYNVETLNPYVHVLCLDPQNIRVMRQTLASISHAISKLYPASKTLTEIQQSEPNQQLMNHYYQNVLPPTAHTVAPPPVTPQVVTPTIESKCKFHVAEEFKTKYDLVQAQPDSLETPCLYLSTGQVYKKDEDPVKYIIDDNIYPTSDHIRHFLPNDTKPENIYQNIITGKLIEVGELDSVAIPHINPHNSVLNENAHFLQSAIPITRARPIIPAANIAITEIARNQHDAHTPCVRIDLLVREYDRLPLFGPLLRTQIGEYLPGYKIVTNLPHVQFGCTSIGNTIDILNEKITPSSQKRLPLVWSSYRYLNVGPYTPAPLRTHIMFITNFRTLFGTNVTLKETEHPATLIPIS